MIYLIESGEHFKIGFTNNWDKRKRAYETHIPVFKVVQLFDGCKDLEKYLHSKLQAHRLERKEWFKVYKDYLIDIYLMIEEYNRAQVNDIIIDNCTITKNVVKYFDIVDAYEWINKDYPKLFNKGKVYEVKGANGIIIILNPNLSRKTTTEETKRLFQTFD